MGTFKDQIFKFINKSTMLGFELYNHTSVSYLKLEDIWPVVYLKLKNDNHAEYVHTIHNLFLIKPEEYKLQNAYK